MEQWARLDASPRSGEIDVAQGVSPGFAARRKSKSPGGATFRDIAPPGLTNSIDRIPTADAVGYVDAAPPALAPPNGPRTRSPHRFTATYIFRMGRPFSFRSNADLLQMEPCEAAGRHYTDCGNAGGLGGSDLEKIPPDDDLPLERLPRRRCPHLLRDRRIVRRHEVRKDQCPHTRGGCDATGILHGRVMAQD